MTIDPTKTSKGDLVIIRSTNPEDKEVIARVTVVKDETIRVKPTDGSKVQELPFDKVDLVHEDEDQPNQDQHDPGDGENSFGTDGNILPDGAPDTPEVEESTVDDDPYEDYDDLFSPCPHCTDGKVENERWKNYNAAILAPVDFMKTNGARQINCPKCRGTKILVSPLGIKIMNLMQHMLNPGALKTLFQGK